MTDAALLNQRLYDAMVQRAAVSRVDTICMGLGYTAVTTTNGGLGLAYTYFDTKSACTLVDEYENYEGRSALNLLGRIRASQPLERCKALALINALNYDQLTHLPDDPKNERLFEILNIGPDSRVAMVGYFKPLVKILAQLGAVVEIIDDFQGMGDKQAFYPKLSGWADTALITSTAILNETMEEILDQLPDHVHAAILGPSTPMVPEAFVAWPVVKALAGIVALDFNSVLTAVRHGLGTPHLHRHSRKATLRLR